MLSLVLTNRDRSLPSSLRGYGRARVFARGVLFLFLSSCAENFQGALWLVADSADSGTRLPGLRSYPNRCWLCV